MIAKTSKPLVLALLLATVAWRGMASNIAEEVISFATHDGLELSGVLSLPADGIGPFPAMLLIVGSGLHDADATLDQPAMRVTDGVQKHFRALATVFSSAGWAVLRYNKRGASFDHIADRPEVLNSSSLEDLVDDAHSALLALRSDSRVSARRLVIYGHSEGTMIATRLAQDRSDIDLLVMAGSVSRGMEALLRYQLVERIETFLRTAADLDRDGLLTLEELDALDGNRGLGSIYIRNSAEVLFALSPIAAEDLRIDGFHPDADRNLDGRLHIEQEAIPAMQREADELIELARSGALGAYMRSLIRAKPTRSLIHRVRAPILFVHGALDVQTPIDEAMSLMARLEARGRTDYDLLVFPRLGHSLSRPNDFVTDDGGLSILDNLTLNAPSKRVSQRLLDTIESKLAQQ